MAVIFVISYNVTLLEKSGTLQKPEKVVRKSKNKWWEVYGEKKDDFKKQVKNVIIEDKRFDKEKEEITDTNVDKKEMGRGGVSGR